MGDNDFDAAWAEGAALSTEEAIAYALRGRGERKRPSTRLGIADPDRTRRRATRRRRPAQQGHRDAAVRLTADRAVAPAHVYNKLGLTSRVQLAQEAARRV